VRKELFQHLVKLLNAHLLNEVARHSGQASLTSRPAAATSFQMPSFPTLLV
jgi:hypothetical protein